MENNKSIAREDKSLIDKSDKSDKKLTRELTGDKPGKNQNQTKKVVKKKKCIS